MKKNNYSFWLAILSFWAFNLSAQPVITSFSPTSGFPGTTVTISGINFDTIISNNIVYFGAVRAVVSSASISSLEVVVPFGSTFENISVTELSTGLTAFSTQPFRTTFDCAGAYPAIYFNPKISYPAGNGSWGSFICDIDNDGKSDICVANSVANTVSIYLNNSSGGNISFAPAVNYAVGTGPRAVSAGDVNGDGKLDLIVANYSSNNISVFKNNSTTGSVSFAPKINFVTGNSPSKLLVTDLNSDGLSEIVVLCEAAGVNVLKNTYNGITISFSGSTYSSGALPSDIASTDIDGDNKTDLVVTNTNGTLAILRNTSIISTVSFAPFTSFSAGTTTVAVRVGDIDGDGKMDVLALNSGSNNFSIFRNLSSIGSISFAPTIDFNTGTGPKGISVGDYDGDGKLDIGVANYNSSSLSIYKNTSTIGFISTNPKIDFNVSFPNTLSTGDLNGDGKDDLVSTSFGSISIFKNIALAPPNSLPPTSITTSSFVANWNSYIGAISYSIDVARDSIFTSYLAGYNNLNVGLATNYFVSGLLPDSNYYYRVRVNVGCGSTSSSNIKAVQILNFPPPIITGISPLIGNIGDLINITGLNFNSIYSNNIVFFGQTRANVLSGTDTTLIVSVPYGASYNPISVTDNSTSLMTFSSELFTPTFFCGGTINSTSFATRIDSIIGSSGNPTKIQAADLNNDGLSDLLTVNSTLSVYKNQSTIETISIASPINYAAGSNGAYFGLAVGDLNGDGLLDAVTTNYSNSSISVFKNTSVFSSISFAPKVDFTSGNGPLSLSINDFNCDGKIDIAIVNSSSNTISILKNNSTLSSISFAPKVDFVTGSSPNNIVSGDIDEDGKPDLIVVNASSNTVSVYRNTSIGGTISFAAKIDYATASGPIDIAIGDIDNDEKLDIITLNSGASNYSVFKNNCTLGTILFNPKIDFTVSSSPKSLSVDDIDGDGKVDILVTINSAPNISFYKNTNSSGIISFATAINYAAAYDVHGSLISDLNNDGKPEVVTSNNTHHSISFYRNIIYTGPKINSTTPSSRCDSGTLTLEASSSGTINWYTTPSGGTPIATGNSFITPSLPVTTNYYVDATNGICTSSPRVVVTASINATINSFAPASGPIGTTVTINGCGFNPTASNNVVYFGATQATVISANSNSLTVTVPVGATHEKISVIDVVNNSIVNSIEPFLVTFVCGDSLSMTSFESKVDITNVPNDEFRVADIDGDGKSDIIKFEQVTGMGHCIAVSRNISNVGNPNFSANSYFSMLNTSSIDLNVNDLDGDGKKDVISISNMGGPQMSILKNTSTAGNISFAPALNYSMGTAALANIYTGDFDGDGRLDIALLRQLNFISILRNTSYAGLISFAPEITFSTNPTSNGVGLTIHDLNGDAKPELIFVNTFSANSVSIYKNQSTVGNISFAPKVTYNAGASYPSKVVAGDLDGDGKPDLIIGNGNASSGLIAIRRNTSTAGGNITFASLQTFSAGAESRHVSLADLDGDGKVDISLASTGYNKVSAFKNISVQGAIQLGARIDYTSGQWPICINNADIDGDGKADILYSYTNSGNALVAVLRNKHCYQYTGLPVWPGDTNNDSLVNNFDLLPIGLHFSQAGSPRTILTNNWQAYPSLDWGTNQVNGFDIKHGDCNGDGIINASDTLAINLNFFSTHLILPETNFERLTNPDLYFTSSDTTYMPGDIIEIDIIAGTSSIPVSNFYGIAFDLNYDASLVQLGSEILFYPNSWLGIPGTNVIKFSKISPLANTAYGSETRIDHVNVNGYGKIATFKFQASNTITSLAQMNFVISNYLSIDSAGNQLFFNTLPYSIDIIPSVTSINNNSVNHNLIIAPNPYTTNTSISYFLHSKSDVLIEIYNAIGQKIETLVNENQQTGEHSYSFSAKAKGYEAGVYLVKITIDGVTTTKRIIEMK